jgi:hypothetical protein
MVLLMGVVFKITASTSKTGFLGGVADAAAGFSCCLHAENTSKVPITKAKKGIQWIERMSSDIYMKWIAAVKVSNDKYLKKSTEYSL